MPSSPRCCAPGRTWATRSRRPSVPWPSERRRCRALPRGSSAMTSCTCRCCCCADSPRSPWPPGPSRPPSSKRLRVSCPRVMRARPCERPARTSGSTPCSGARPAGCAWSGRSVSCWCRSRPGRWSRGSTGWSPATSRTRESLSALFAAMPPPARAALERLLTRPVVGTVVNPRRTPDPARSGVDWLLAHHFVVPFGADRVVVPGEVVRLAEDGSPSVPAAGPGRGSEGLRAGAGARPTRPAGPSAKAPTCSSAGASAAHHLGG